MREEKFSNYTFEVPLRFTFKATAEQDPEMLLKMADSYLDLVLKAETYEIKDTRLHLVKEERIYSKEEMEEREKVAKALDEFLGKPLTELGHILNIRSLRG